MKLRHMLKRTVAAALMMSMLLTVFTGCQGKGSDEEKKSYTGYEKSAETKALVVGDYTINMDEFMIYAMQYMIVNGITGANYDEKKLEDYKEYTISQIREIKNAYHVAVSNKCELDDSDLKTVQDTFDTFKGKYDADFLKAYGITDDKLMEVFKEQALVAKYSAYIKKDMGEKMLAETKKAYENDIFSTIYMIIFPTVEVGADGQPKQDDNKKYVYVSEAEKAKIKEKAEAARKEILAGEDYLKVVEKYGVKDYCSETNLYKDQYSEKLYNRIKDLKDGECSEILDETLGYDMVYMIKKDDDEKRQIYIETLVDKAVEEQFEGLYKKWMAVIPIDKEGDLNGTVIKDFDLVTFIKDLTTASPKVTTESTTES